eukprot:362866-Chlamydomonas_euryale.AAC.28
MDASWSRSDACRLPPPANAHIGAPAGRRACKNRAPAAPLCASIAAILDTSPATPAEMPRR